MYSINKKFEGLKKNIVIGFRVFSPFSLYIYGYDPTKENTYYFRRRFPFQDFHFNNIRKGEGVYKEINIFLPLTPKELKIEIFTDDLANDKLFKVEKFNIKDLNLKDVKFEPKTDRFLKFAELFAEQAGYIEPGRLHEENGEFLIEFFKNYVYDKHYGYSKTPARISRRTSRLQISGKMFRPMTVPMRYMIQNHEWIHYINDTQSETECDILGATMYLERGYPKTEALYAFTKIFSSDDDESVDRVRDVKKFIKNYKRNIS